MKILSPLDNVNEVEKLAEAGAGEFYCGLLEQEWHDRYPVISINRRPAGKGHFRKFSELAEAVKTAHSLDIKVFFTLNEHYYINGQYSFLMRYVEEALTAGVDAFIVADYGLMVYLREKKYKAPIHVSTGSTVFNWRSVKFFKELGVEKITFPRHLTIEEIREIVSKMPRVDTTVFIMNSRCINVDGFCTFQHGLAGREIFPMFRNACMLPFHTTAYCNSQEEEEMQNRKESSMTARQNIWENVHVDDYPCGACALYEFREMGISSIKIVGRGNPLNRKTADVLFLVKLLRFLDEKKPAKKSFRAEAQNLYQQTYKRACRLHMCYYPSVMLTTS